VLAPRHPNMLVGYVSTQRSTPVDPDTALSAHPRVIGPEAFTLEVGFAHASPSDTGPMPDQLEAQVTPRGADAEPWLAAAARLRPSPAAYGGLIGSGAGESNDRYFLVSGASSIDPWLRVARTVQSDAAEQAFAQCHAGPHVATFAARWTIAPDGRVIDAAAEPMTRDGGDAGAEAGCVRDALQALAFPCTRSGQPATVSVRICIGRHRWR
jgi:hypothetical protein